VGPLIELFVQTCATKGKGVRMTETLQTVGNARALVISGFAAGRPGEPVITQFTGGSRTMIDNERNRSPMPELGSTDLAGTRLEF
jgi:hypothetical protein